MQQPPPIMFVLVDASRWQAPGLPLSCGEVGTVKAHMKRILSKLGAKDRTHAVLLALKRGILEV